MSVQSEIDRLENAKAAIKTAVEGKGVTVPSATKLDEMAPLIESITPMLQSKSVTITSNGTINISPDSGYDGLSKVNVTVNVSGGSIETCSVKFDLLSTGSSYSYYVQYQKINDQGDIEIVSSSNNELQEIVSDIPVGSLITINSTDNAWLDAYSGAVLVADTVFKNSIYIYTVKAPTVAGATGCISGSVGE